MACGCQGNNVGAIIRQGMRGKPRISIRGLPKKSPEPPQEMPQEIIVSTGITTEEIKEDSTYKEGD